MSTAHVVALSLAPVKGLRIARRESVRLERRGVIGDRCFYLIDDRGRMVNAKHNGALHEISAELDEGGQVLTLSFRSGERITAAVALGAELTASYRSDARPARLIDGPFSEAISAHAGEELRLVGPADGSPGVDRGVAGAVTLVAAESLQELSRLPDREGAARRVRMSIEVAGAGAFRGGGLRGRQPDL